MEEIVKQGGWANMSTTSKILIITLGVVTLGVGAYFVFRKPDDESSVSKKKSTASESDESELSEDLRAGESTSDPVVKVPVHPTQTESPPIKKKVDPTLPNGGVGCSDVITDHGRDLDFVKFNGAWYGKVKSDPANKSAIDQYPSWTSFEKNVIVSERLNRRYPNI